MHGFFITISNGLLKDGHRKRIGTAVWEFMWCIDKITKIDDSGVGWVLGGKPINLSELAKLMEVGEDTISLNLSKLEKEGYIEKTRTPYGLVIKVIHAKKRFGKKSDMGKILNLRESSKTPNLVEKTPNVHIDNTVDITPKTRKDIKKLEIVYPIWLNIEKWKEWEQHRKEIKRPLTSVGVKLQLKFISLHIKDHVNIIDQSIKNGWTGLFELKNGFNGNGDAQRVFRKQREEREAEEERESSKNDSESKRKLNEDIKSLAKDKTLK